MNLNGSLWQFSRHDGTKLGQIELLDNKRIGLYQNWNESTWDFADDKLAFFNGNGRLKTLFKPADDGGWLGDFEGKIGFHVLRPLALSPPPPFRTAYIRDDKFNIKKATAYCLSTKGENRRQSHCCHEIRWMGFERVVIVEGTLETEAPDGYAKKSFYGASKNHSTALKDFKTERKGYAGFFEDDLLLSSALDTLPDVMAALDQRDWHMFFFKSGNEGNIAQRLGPINQLYGAPVTGLNYLVRDSGGFLDYLLTITDTSNPTRRIKHHSHQDRFVIDWLLHRNLLGWNIYGSAADLNIHDHRIFKQRSMLEK